MGKVKSFGWKNVKRRWNVVHKYLLRPEKYKIDLETEVLKVMLKNAQENDNVPTGNLIDRLKNTPMRELTDKDWNSICSPKGCTSDGKKVGLSGEKAWDYGKS